MHVCFIGIADNIHTIRWVRYFVDKGYKVSVISWRPEAIPGARIYSFPEFVESPSRVARIFDFFTKFIKFRLLLIKLKPDIVHIHFTPSHKESLFYFGVKNIIASTWGSDVVDQIKFPGKIHRYRRFFFKQAKVITATTNFLAKATSKYTEKEIHIIPFGVNCEDFSPEKKTVRNDGLINIGFVKHLLPTYGPEYLILAMNLVVKKRPNVRLLMAGKGDMLEELNNLVKSLELDNNVKFVGKIPHNEVPVFLANIDIFVMPSNYDSFGVAAIEAQAMEIPVVATNVGGIPEAIVDGETGILVEPRSPRKLADAIISLIDNPELRAEMGKNGRKYVMKYFLWKKNAKEMEAIYQSVVSFKG